MEADAHQLYMEDRYLNKINQLKSLAKGHLVYSVRILPGKNTVFLCSLTNWN